MHIIDTHTHTHTHRGEPGEREWRKGGRRSRHGNRFEELFAALFNGEIDMSTAATFLSFLFFFYLIFRNIYAKLTDTSERGIQK